MEPGHFWTAFVWAIIPFVILLWGLWSLDRYEKEPSRLLFLALIFGAVLGPLVAWAIEKGLDISSSFSSQLIVPKDQLGVGTPIVEELVRGGAVTLVFLIVRWEVDDILDGIVYGGIVGLGFGGAANFISIWETKAIGHANASMYASLITALNHVFYGALVGLALALFRKSKAPLVAGAAVAGTGLAFGFHLLHDYLPWVGASSAGNIDSAFWREVLTQAPNYFGVFVLGCISVWAVGREKLIISRQLREEVSAGTVTADEYAEITSGFRRSYILLLDLLWRGERVWRLRRRLYTTEIELAFRKYHRGDREQSQSRAYSDEEDYRTQIADLRVELAKWTPAAAESRRTEATGGPSNTIVAGVGAASMFAVLVGLGVLLWFFAFRPDSQSNTPTINGISAPAVAMTATRALSASTAGGSSAGLEAAKKSVNVVLCKEVRISTCVGTVKENGKLPRQTAHFLVTVQYKNLNRGDELTLGFFSGETRQPVANEVRARITRTTGFFFVPFDGPFPKLDLVVAMLYNGARVDKVWHFNLV